LNTSKLRLHGVLYFTLHAAAVIDAPTFAKGFLCDARAAKFRRLWLNVHLWIGVGLAAMLRKAPNTRRTNPQLRPAE